MRPRPAVDSWWEPFGGSFALALALEAGQRPPFSYQGGKSCLSEPTLRALGLVPGARARRYIFNDLGEITQFYRALQVHAGDIAARIERMPAGRAAYDEVYSAPVPVDPVLRAVAYAVLQGCAVQGKPPHVVNGVWKCAGYASLSPAAVSRGFTEKFLPRTLAKRLWDVGQVLAKMNILWLQQPAETIQFPNAGRRAVVYVDPPYAKTTGFRHTCTEEALRDMVRRGQQSGFTVAVAEATGDLRIGRLVELLRTDGRPLPRNRREYLMVAEAE